MELPRRLSNYSGYFRDSLNILFFFFRFPERLAFPGFKRILVTSVSRKLCNK